MKTFLKIIGLIVLAALFMFIGSVLQFKFCDSSRNAPEASEKYPFMEGKGFWLVNSDLTLVKSGDEIRADTYFMVTLDIYELLQIAEGAPVTSDKVIIPDRKYNSNNFSLADGEGNILDTLTFTPGQTWAQWCKSEHNIYKFAIVVDCVLCNAEAKGFN